MIVIHGTVVEEDGAAPGQITIEDNRITSFVRWSGKPRRAEPHQLMSYAEYQGRKGIPEFLIFPGFVDIYSRKPEMLPALSGGVTSVIGYGSQIEPGDEMFNDLSDCKNVAFNWSDGRGEAEGVRSAIEQTKTHGLKSRIIISTVESLRIVQQAKEDGWDVYSEVHPINLYFDTSMVTPENERSLRVSPTIRSPEERKLLLGEFAAGSIDIISSGHTPHGLSDGKCGVPELDTFGPMMIWLINQGVPPEVIFKTACLNPASWVPSSVFMIGRIKEGYDASVTVLAFNKPTIDSRQLYTNCGWSPYDLRSFSGSVEAVIMKGEKVVNAQWMKSFQD